MTSRPLTALLGLGVLFVGCHEDIVIEEPCPPTSADCEGHDHDGDAVANGDDDFPEDGTSAVRDDANSSPCSVDCGQNQMCTPEGTCVCMNAWTGASCDVCADLHYALPDCTSCLPKYTGTDCDACAVGYEGPECEWLCDNGLVGPGCDEVTIAAGTYTVGSPETEPCRDSDETVHAVTLSRSFTMKTTEVTQAEWSALMNNNPSGFAGCDDCPVETVNWYETLAYCNALSESHGLEACYALTGCNGTTAGDGMECTDVTVTAPDGDMYACAGYRLPTEAEWEVAARAGTATSTYNGDIPAEQCSGASPVLEPIAWYLENSSYETHSVGQKDANAWGLYDTFGNVWEWVWDRYGAYPGDVTDPIGASTGSSRVARGWSWYGEPRGCRSASRSDDAPGVRWEDLGFRPARSLP